METPKKHIVLNIKVDKASVVMQEFVAKIDRPFEAPLIHTGIFANVSFLGHNSNCIFINKTNFGGFIDEESANVIRDILSDVTTDRIKKSKLLAKRLPNISGIQCDDDVDFCKMNYRNNSVVVGPCVGVYLYNLLKDKFIVAPNVFNFASRVHVYFTGKKPGDKGPTKIKLMSSFISPTSYDSEADAFLLVDFHPERKDVLLLKGKDIVAYPAALFDFACDVDIDAAADAFQFASMVGKMEDIRAKREEIYTPPSKEELPETPVEPPDTPVEQKKTKKKKPTSKKTK